MIRDNLKWFIIGAVVLILIVGAFMVFRGSEAPVQTATKLDNIIAALPADERPMVVRYAGIGELERDVYFDGTYYFEGKGEGVVILAYEGNGKEVYVPSDFYTVPTVELTDNSFRDKDLTAINVPDNVETIGNDAFAGNDLDNIFISSTVIDMDTNPFRDNKFNNRENVSVVIDPANPVYESIDGNIYNKDEEKLVVGTNPIIKDGTKVIGEGAYDGSDIKEIIVPEGVETIEKDAFKDNDDLEKIVIPSTVSEIDEDFIDTERENEIEIIIHPDNPVFEVREDGIYNKDEDRKIIDKTDKISIKEGDSNNVDGIDNGQSDGDQSTKEEITYIKYGIPNELYEKMDYYHSDHIFNPTVQDLIDSYSELVGGGHVYQYASFDTNSITVNSGNDNTVYILQLLSKDYYNALMMAEGPDGPSLPEDAPYVYLKNGVNDNSTIKAVLDLVNINNPDNSNIVYYNLFGLDAGSVDDEVKAQLNSIDKAKTSAAPKDGVPAICFETAMVDGLFTITDYNSIYEPLDECPRVDLVIPSVIDGYKVEVIGEEAFWYSEIKGTVVIPEGVRAIGYNAFNHNRLTGVVLPTTLDYVGFGAFSFNGPKQDVHNIPFVSLTNYSSTPNDYKIFEKLNPNYDRINGDLAAGLWKVVGYHWEK